MSWWKQADIKDLKKDIKLRISKSVKDPETIEILTRVLNVSRDHRLQGYFDGDVYDICNDRVCVRGDGSNYIDANLFEEDGKEKKPVKLKDML